MTLLPIDFGLEIYGVGKTAPHVRNHVQKKHVA